MELYNPCSCQYCTSPSSNYSDHVCSSPKNQRNFDLIYIDPHCVLSMVLDTGYTVLIKHVIECLSCDRHCSMNIAEVISNPCKSYYIGNIAPLERRGCSSLVWVTDLAKFTKPAGNIENLTLLSLTSKCSTFSLCCAIFQSPQSNKLL